MRLQAQRVLVTGAGRGIGRACAEAAAREGARLVIASRTRAELEEVAAHWPAAAPPPRVVPCDVGDSSQVRGLFARAVEDLGGLDGSIHCAAIFHRTPWRELDLAAWEEVLRINLTGTLLCCREALNCLRPGGAIVNFSSFSGLPGVEKFPGFAAYNVSKYGVSGLTEILAVEARTLGVRVNCLSPAAVNTSMLRAAAPQLPPAMEPEEVARVAVFLLSDDSRAINGANLMLAGPPRAGGRETRP